MNEIEQTNEALVLVTRVLSETIQLVSRLAEVLHETGQLDTQQTKATALNLLRIAELMDDHDELQPARLAQHLHQQASRMQ